MEDLVLKMWPMLAFLLVQTIAGVWWAATVSAKVKQLDDDMAGFAGSGERFAKIETLLTELIKKVDSAISKRGNGGR